MTSTTSNFEHVEPKSSDTEPKYNNENHIKDVIEIGQLQKHKNHDHKHKKYTMDACLNKY